MPKLFDMNRKVFVAFNRNCYPKMKYFLKVTVTYTVKLVVSQKWWKIDTLLLHSTNRKYHMAQQFVPFHMESCTRCYLPPDRSDIPALIPATLVLDLATKEGCKGESANLYPVCKHSRLPVQIVRRANLAVSELEWRFIDLSDRGSELARRNLIGAWCAPDATAPPLAPACWCWTVVVAQRSTDDLVRTTPRSRDLSDKRHEQDERGRSPSSKPPAPYLDPAGALLA